VVNQKVAVFAGHLPILNLEGCPLPIILAFWLLSPDAQGRHSVVFASLNSQTYWSNMVWALEGLGYYKVLSDFLGCKSFWDTIYFHLAGGSANC
jgi:hypothetical protein